MKNIILSGQTLATVLVEGKPCINCRRNKASEAVSDKMGSTWRKVVFKCLINSFGFSEGQRGVD